MAYRSSTGLTPGSGNTVVINVPAGAAINDIAVVSIYKENDRAITPPAGFAEKAALATSATARGSLYVYWKRLTAADTGTYTFSWGAGGVWRSATCVLFSGRTTTGDPFDGTVGTAESTTAVTTLNVSTSPTNTGGDAVGSWTNFQGGNSYTAPTNYTERQDLDVIGLFTRDNVASGSTGSISATSNVSGFQKAFLGVLAAAGAGATDVTPADAGHAHAADQPALTQVHALASNDAAHAHTADQPALTQVHVIAVDSATHAHTADQATVSTAGATDITVDDATHAHAADQPALTQVHILAPDAATHAHSADQPTLGQVHALTPADASHGHTSEQPSITSGIVIVPADALHGHSVDAATLSQLHVLAPADALHGHTAESPLLTQVHILAVADALHAHTADVVTIVDTSGFRDITATATLTARWTGSLTNGATAAVPAARWTAVLQED